MIAELDGVHRLSSGYLRPARTEDSVWLHGLLEDPEYASFWRRRTYTQAEITDEVRRDVRSDDVALFLVWPAPDIRVGHVRVELDRENQLGTVGYGVARAMWGRGYASCAVVKLVRLCFDKTDTMKLCARVDPRNAGSVRVLHRAGFVAEGRLVSHLVRRGERVDRLLFGLTRQRWAGTLPSGGD